MKLLAILRDALTGAFSDLSLRTGGRLGFFMLYVFLFSLIAGIISFGVMYVILSVDPPNFYDYDYGYNRGSGLADSLASTGSFTVIMLIFLMRYYKKGMPEKQKKFSMGDMFNSVGGSDWLYFIGGIVVIILVSYYLAPDVRLYGGPSTASLEGMFANVGLDSGAGFSWWIDAVIMYLITYLPILIMTLYMVSIKHDGLRWENLRKYGVNLLAFLILFVAVSGAYESISKIISRLVISIVAIPVQEFYITIIFAIVVFLIMSGVYYMVLSKIVFYCFFKPTNVVEPTPEPIEVGDDVDLLDQ